VHLLTKQARNLAIGTWSAWGRADSGNGPKADPGTWRANLLRTEPGNLAQENGQEPGPSGPQEPGPNRSRNLVTPFFVFLRTPTKETHPYVFICCHMCSFVFTCVHGFFCVFMLVYMLSRVSKFAHMFLDVLYVFMFHMFSCFMCFHTLSMFSYVFWREGNWSFQSNLRRRLISTHFAQQASFLKGACPTTFFEHVFCQKTTLLCQVFVFVKQKTCPTCSYTTPTRSCYASSHNLCRPDFNRFQALVESIGHIISSGSHL
jgi:hypothetical protein